MLTSSIPDYVYSLYRDKNREIPIEFLDGPEKQTPQTNTQTNDWWSYVNSPYGYVLAFISILVILVSLYFSIQLAFQIARTPNERMVHLFFAIVYSPIYLFIHVASLIWQASSMGLAIN